MAPGWPSNGRTRFGIAARRSEHRDRIALEAHRVDALIGQLLTLSRIDSGVQIGERATVDLTNLVHEVASDGDFEARARGRRVVVTAAAAGVISGFEEPIRSALENVVRNAIRHTREGTSVEISLERLSGSDGRLALRVRDHGDGVPETMLTDIFLPFRRVPGSTDHETEGAGLGLAIAGAPSRSRRHGARDERRRRWLIVDQTRLRAGLERALSVRCRRSSAIGDEDDRPGLSENPI